MKSIEVSRIPLLVFAILSVLASTVATGFLIWDSSQTGAIVFAEDTTIASKEVQNQVTDTAKADDLPAANSQNVNFPSGGATFTVKPYVAVTANKKHSSFTIAVVDYSNEYSVRAY
jgi:type II secretory pathway pseudopilin PulG